MEWTKGIAAILLCSALLLVPTHCVPVDFSVQNLVTQDVTSMGFKVNWVAPSSSTTAECYLLELWSGTTLVETKIVGDQVTTPPTEYTFEGLPDNMSFFVVVYSVSKSGTNNEFELYSLPKLTPAVTTSDSTLTLTARDTTSVTLSFEPPATNPPDRYEVIYRDVTEGPGTTIDDESLNRADITTLTLSNLDSSGGRLIKVTVRRTDEDGDLITEAWFRTALAQPNIGDLLIEDETLSSVKLNIPTFPTTVDMLAFEIECAEGGICDIGDGLSVPTTNNVATLVEGLTPDVTYRIRVKASSGNNYPDLNYPNNLPSYVESASGYSNFVLAGQTLNPVTGLDAQTFSQTSITVIWDEATPGVDNYELDISPAPAEVPKGGRFSTTMPTYTFFGLTAGVQYTIGVRVVVEDPNNSGTFLAQSSTASAAFTTRSTGLSRSSCGTNKNSVTLSWTNTITSPSQFEITLKSFYDNSGVDQAISPSTVQVVEWNDNNAVFEGLQAGNRYIAELRERTAGGSNVLLTTMVFRCLIAIAVDLNELNPMYSLLQFKPADSIEYDTYKLQVTSASSEAECQAFKDDFGCQDLNLDGCACGRYLAQKPAICQVTFGVAAYIEDQGDIVVSNTVSLSANDNNIQSDVVYDGEIGPTYVDVWWQVDKNPDDFDFYYLKVTETDNNNDMKYCTAIPCPTDPFVKQRIDGLAPGQCYTLRLERWRYTEVGNANNVALDALDIERQICTGLGDTGKVSSLYVLEIENNNVDLGWGTSSLPATDFTGYQVCIEPVKNPSSYTPLTEGNDVQMRELTNVIDRDFSQFYRVGVLTYIEESGRRRQYSNTLCEDQVDLDAPFRGALDITDAGITTLDIQWQRDEEFLPTTNNYRITVFDADEQQVGNQITVTTSSTPISRTLTNLESGTYYCVEVLWIGTVPQVMRKVCGRTCPSQPGTITISYVDLTSIGVTWDEAAGNRDFYIIYATDLTNNGDRERKGRVENDAISFNVVGLIPDTNYLIEVVAIAGTESDNKPSEARSDSPTTLAIPDCEIIITSLYKDWIEVRWGPCQDADTIQICPRPGPPPAGNPDFNDIVDLPLTGNNRVYKFEGLRASKKYSIFLKDSGVIIDTATKYTEPFQPTLEVVSRGPTTVTVEANSPTGQDFPDDLHTVVYEIYNEDDELLRSVTQNGQRASGLQQYVWRGLEPDTEYTCKATIKAGYELSLQTPSDPLETAVPCYTTVPAANKIYVQACEENSFSLLWGELTGSSRYQIDVSPPPQGSLYRFNINSNLASSQTIGSLAAGQTYDVTLLRGTGVDPDEVDSIKVFTKPSQVQPFEVEKVDQTSISISWSWPYRQDIDYFAIDFNPVIAPQQTPGLVPFWHRDYVIKCLLPGHEVDVTLSSVIKNSDDYYFSQSYSRTLTPTNLPQSVLHIICACVSYDSFTVAWSDWDAPSGFDFDGYVLNLYTIDGSTVNSIDEVKVAPDDGELFHHFYNLGDEFNGTPYELLPTRWYIICVTVVGTTSDERAYKAVLTRPRPPKNLRRVDLPDPESKTAIKVRWDPPDDSNVDYYKVYWNRFGFSDVIEDTVNPSDGDPLEYTLSGLDPLAPNADIDLGNPNERPAAYNFWVVAVYTATFTPPGTRKKRQVVFDGLEEMEVTVASESSILQNQLTESIDPMEILIQEVETRSILSLFGASPDNANPDGKYRFFINTEEVPFVARGGTLDVADANYFFPYEFDGLIPGTVFTVTLSVELEEPVDGQPDIRSSIEVLTCPEPPVIIERANNDAVTADFSWPLPFGQYTYFEVTFERPGENPETETTEDPEITFERLFPDMEYTVTVRTVRVWERENEDDVTKKSEPVSLTIETTDLSALQIAIQDFGTNFINIVFGETIQDVVYEVSIDPGNCPCGWREFGDSCYYIGHARRSTYADAQNYCESKDGNLVSIISQEEQDFLDGCTGNDPDTSNFGFWLGLNDLANEGAFVFEDGSVYDVGYTGNWATGQPDNGGTGGNEDCAIMWQIPSQENNWGDVSCSQEQGFICKKQKANPGVNYPVQPSATAAHAFTQLVPGQCYTITVDADEYAAQSEQQRTDPDPVSGITLEEVSPAYARLSWTLPNGIHDGFYVSYVVKDSGEDPTHYPYRLLKGVEGVKLWDLEPDTEYVVSVYTVASYGDCDELTSLAQEFEFSTNDLQPGNVYLKDKDTDSITVTWGEAQSPQTLVGYRFFVCPDSCDENLDDPIVCGPDRTEYTFDGLVPGREYSIRFQAVRTGGNNDAMQLIVTRTLPLGVRNFEAESFPDKIKFTWEAPLGGDYDQYVLWYSTCNCLHPGETDLQYEVLDKSRSTYDLWVYAPNTIVFAALSARSQVECPSEPSDSIPAFIYGTETDNLASLEIFIIKRDTNSILLFWGPVAGEDVLYTLSWYPEADQSNPVSNPPANIKQRITKNTVWLIQGLDAGASYYINVEYANLQSPNDGFFATKIPIPTGLTVSGITPTSALLNWNEVGAKDYNYKVFYEPWDDQPQYKCAAKIVHFDDVDSPLSTDGTEAPLTYLDPNVQYRVRLIAQETSDDPAMLTFSSDPAMLTFTTNNVQFGECEIVGVYSTSILAVWGSVTGLTDVYRYRHTVRVDATDEVHGVQEFSPSDHPYVKFENLWPGTQYEVCCEVLRINIPVPAENCIKQVTAPQGPFTASIRDEDLRGFCVYWDGPHSDFDNYVIKILNEDGVVVYPPAGVATLPAGDPQYEALPPDHTYRCIDTLLPGNTYTVQIGTWVDGDPEPEFSDRLEIEATTESLDPLEIFTETQAKNALTIQWGAIDEAGVENPQYTVEWFKEGSTALPLTFGTTNTRYTINGLEAGKGYNIRVLYLDEESENSGFFYTEPCPPQNLAAINNVDFPRSGTRFSLSWNPPTDGGYEGFRISYVDPDSATNEKVEAGVVEAAGVLVADTLSYTVVGLNVNQAYTFCVETIVGFDVLPNDTSSEPVSIQGSTDDLAPLVIEVSGRGTDHFLVGWGALDNPSAQETQYVITALPEAGTLAAIDLVPIGEPTNSRLFPLNSGIKYNIQVQIGDRESDVVCMYTIPKSPGIYSSTKRHHPHLTLAGDLQRTLLVNMRSPTATEECSAHSAEALRIAVWNWKI
ncbi:uncharacterized protein [Amphiura filiformis]|uniref:uncharacterized protein n=1 Tax=Amphiura filiformis TaxID=82378 RepID=UPI003B20E8F3